MILPKIASGIRRSMWSVKGMLVMSQQLVEKMYPTPIIRTTSLYIFTCREISEVILGLHPSRFWQIHICSVTSFWWFAAKASWDNFCFFHRFEEKMQILTPFQTEHCKKKSTSVVVAHVVPFRDEGQPCDQPIKVFLLTRACEPDDSPGANR